MLAHFESVFRAPGEVFGEPLILPPPSPSQ
jgi:hypothetical protein